MGSLLLGIRISSEIGSEPFSIRELVPPEMRDVVEDANSVVISKGINIIILPFRAAIGGAIGGLIGFALSFVIRKWTPPKNKVDMKVSKKHSSLVAYNLKVLFISICLVIDLWLGFYIVIVQFMSDPLDSLKFSVARQFAALLAIICSWAAVRKKFVWSDRWDKRKNSLMLGPFRRKRIPFMNDKQLKALWITAVFMFLSLLFPPWVAYKFAAGNIGTGRPTFAGFHFISSSQYSVLGLSPYVLTRISYKLLGIWELILLAVFVIMMVIFRKKKLKS